MTHAEKSLVRANRPPRSSRCAGPPGDHRPSLGQAVKALTDRTVMSFMSANAVDPDAAAEIFVMDRAV